MKKNKMLRKPNHLGSHRREKERQEVSPNLKTLRRKKNDIKAVINCPCTSGGELTKRAGEEEMRGPTGYVVKVVKKKLGRQK